jgi:hypothetical protein
LETLFCPDQRSETGVRTKQYICFCCWTIDSAFSDGGIVST